MSKSNSIAVSLFHFSNEHSLLGEVDSGRRKPFRENLPSVAHQISFIENFYLSLNALMDSILRSIT
jgi:hypothetical protein